MTIYVQIVGKDDPFLPDMFRPWIKARDVNETIGLALQHHVRCGGYYALPPGERPVLERKVAFYKDGDPLHPNGRPMVVNVWEVTLTPTEL